MVTMPPDRLPVTADRDRYTEAVAAMARVSPPAEARLAWQSILARWPGTFAAEVGLANSLYALRELPASEALLRQALAREPASAPVMNNLAMVLGDEGRIDEALALLGEAERMPG